VTAYYNELDPQKAAWLRELIRRDVIADGEVDERSIEQVEAKDLKGFAQCHFFAGIGVWSYALRLAGWPDERPVWTGSCPCPSFSAAGQGRGFTDARHLWPAWARLIGKCKPATSFGEQVDDAIGHGWLDLVQTDLERENYAVGKAVLGACSVGAPHIRQRLYFVADAEAAQVFARSGEISARAGTHHTNGFGIGGRYGRMGKPDRTRSQPGSDAAAPNRHGDTDLAASGAGELAEPTSHGRQYESPFPGSDASRTGARRARGESGIDGTPGELADANGGRFAMHGAEDARERQPEQRVEGDVGEPIGARLEGHRGDGASGNKPGWFGAQSDGPVTEAGYVNGFWRNADWVLRKRWNRDDWEWCPTEPGTFPLASGVANRVLKLRGYGDAICAPLAAEFIKATM